MSYRMSRHASSNLPPPQKQASAVPQLASDRECSDREGGEVSVSKVSHKASLATQVRPARARSSSPLARRPKSSTRRVGHDIRSHRVGSPPPSSSSLLPATLPSHREEAHHCRRRHEEQLRDERQPRRGRDVQAARLQRVHRGADDPFIPDPDPQRELTSSESSRKLRGRDSRRVHNHDDRSLSPTALSRSRPADTSPRPKSGGRGGWLERENQVQMNRIPGEECGSRSFSLSISIGKSA